MKKYNISGLILAAGFSGRMGEYKPLLNYEGKSFIQNIIMKLNVVCDKITIVTGFREKDIRINVNELKIEELKSKLEFVFNENYQAGMFSSLKKGIGACSKSDWLLYHFVDQPILPFEFYTKFISQIDSNYNWIQPQKDGRRGHPVLLKKEIFSIITKHDEKGSLKIISDNPAIVKKFWECEYESIFTNINHKKDYLNLF